MRIKNILSKPDLKQETLKILESRYREHAMVEQEPIEELKEYAIRSQIGFEEALFNTGDNLQEVLMEVSKTKNLDLNRKLSGVSKSASTTKSISRANSLNFTD